MQLSLLSTMRDYCFYHMQLKGLYILVFTLVACTVIMWKMADADLSILTKYLSVSTQLVGGTKQSLKQTLEPTKGRLPVLAVDRRFWLKYKGKTWRGLQLPVITIGPQGRLGNMIGEYASLYGVGRAYNATVRLHPYLSTELSNAFPDLSMPLIPGNFDPNEWTPIRYFTTGRYASIEAAAAGLLGPRLFLAQGAPCEPQLFNAYRKEILGEFTFSMEIQKKVSEFWIKNRPVAQASVYVGFHIRRTDFINYVKAHRSHLPGALYFRNSMDYYRNKFGSVLFVVASDDLAFAKTALANYTDVIYTPGTPRELDMAILVSCNHSIITLGTFGFWTGYLTGGLVLYPNITLAKDFPLQRERYEMSRLDFFILTESD